MKNLIQKISLGTLLILGLGLPLIAPNIYKLDQKRIEDALFHKEKAEYRNIHALILSGQTKEKDDTLNQIRNSYKTLISKKVNPQNIHIFNNPENAKTSLEELMSETNVYQNLSPQQTLEAISSISSDENSLLFVYVTGHGEQTEMHEPAISWKVGNKSQNIPLADFFRTVDPLPYKYRLMFFPACYGGDFAQMFWDDASITMSAAEPGKKVNFGIWKEYSLNLLFI